MIHYLKLKFNSIKRKLSRHLEHFQRMITALSMSDDLEEKKIVKNQICDSFPLLKTPSEEKKSKKIYKTA